MKWQTLNYNTQKCIYSQNIRPKTSKSMLTRADKKLWTAKIMLVIKPACRETIVCKGSFYS